MLSESIFFRLLNSDYKQRRYKNLLIKFFLNDCGGVTSRVKYYIPYEVNRKIIWVFNTIITIERGAIAVGMSIPSSATTERKNRELRSRSQPYKAHFFMEGGIKLLGRLPKNY